MPSRFAIRFGIPALAALCATVLLTGAAGAAELVMIRRDGCPWCARWDREIGPIYPKTDFSRRAPLRMINLDHDPKPAFAHRAIIYTPTFVLVEADRELGRIEGYPGDEFFWARLANLLEEHPVQGPEGGSAPASGATPVPAERM